MDNGKIDQVAVFTATISSERRALGHRVSDWLESFDGEVIDKAVTQSSDNQFHCITVTLWCSSSPKRKRAVRA